MFRWMCVGAALAGSTAVAAEGAWETVSTEPYLIKTRSVEGSAVKEIWAEGEIHAPAQDVQSALMDADGFRSFMPYVKESRTLGEKLADGSRYVYTRLELPWVSSRDYVLRVKLESDVGPDGTGEFRNSWVAAPDHLPSRANVVRLRVNEGSWHVVPKGPNRSYAVYRFNVDPGGWIPAFAADAGNRKGVTETFQAVEREAQRRAEARRQANESAAAGVPSPSAQPRLAR